MSAEFFLDTNILVYSFAEDEPDKCGRARALIEEALASGAGAISWQVVQEFLNVSLHKWERPLSTRQAATYLDNTLRPLCRVFPSVDLWHSALRIQALADYRFYDSLIVASAAEIEARILYTEDLQHGRRFDQMRIVNPFVTNE